jgi:hypothetical protein
MTAIPFTPLQTLGSKLPILGVYFYHPISSDFSFLIIFINVKKSILNKLSFMGNVKKLFVKYSPLCTFILTFAILCGKMI